jgi:hypothetical protein
MLTVKTLMNTSRDKTGLMLSHFLCDLLKHISQNLLFGWLNFEGIDQSEDAAFCFYCGHEFPKHSYLKILPNMISRSISHEANRPTSPLSLMMVDDNALRLKHLEL